MLLIKNGKVYTMSDAHVIENCDILIKDGKIIEVKQNIECEEAEVIDATDKVVIPGVIDAHSHIGTFNVITGDQDANEMTNPARPELEIYYGIDPNSPSFDECVRDGVTTSLIVPGSGNMLGGTGLIIKSKGESYDSRIMKDPAVLKAAMGINPKGAYGLRDQLPSSRMGVAKLFIEFFEGTKDYMKKKEEANGDKDKMPPYNKGFEHGQLVLEKKIPLKVHSYQHDMMSLLRWKKEYGFDLTLDHAFGSSDFYDEIAESGADVILGPIDGPLFGGEGCKSDIECLQELDRRGVNCAIMTDGPVYHPYMLYMQAGETVRRGCDVETALKFLTIGPARILRVADRIGSIEAGKDADIAIFDKTPCLDTDATCIKTIIDGKVVFSK